MGSILILKDKLLKRSASHRKNAGVVLPYGICTIHEGGYALWQFIIAVSKLSAGAMGNRQLLLRHTGQAKSSRMTAPVLSMTLRKNVVWYSRKFPFRHMHHRNMLTMRGIKRDDSWAAKEKKIYALDEEGKRIPLIDPATGEQKLGKRNEKLWKRITVEPNDWNDHSKAEIWRKSWVGICNEYLSLEQQIDHRSYKRQELDLEPTIHEGYRARKMEKAGFVSNRCEYNRIVRKLNELKGRWLLTVKELCKE